MTKFHTVNRRKMNEMAAKLMQELELDVDVTQNLEEYSLALQQMIAITYFINLFKEMCHKHNANTFFTKSSHHDKQFCNLVVVQ